MADNVVDLIVDIKLEGKKELKTYTKELKSLVKVLEAMNKSSFKNVNKLLKEQQTALKKTGTETKKLTAENKKLQAQVKKSTAENKKFNESLKNTETNATNSSFALNKVSLGVAAGVAGIVAWTNATVQSNIELEQQARLAGLSVQEFEKWAFAAKTVGVSADQMADAFNEIGLKSQDALQEKSGGFYDQLNKLNIDIKEFTQLDPAAQFEKLGDAISGLNAQEQKFALDEIASDSGIQTQKVLENITELKTRIQEVQALGGFVSEAQRKEISDFNTEMTTFTQLIGTSSTKAFSALAPVFSEFLTDLTAMLGLINQANDGELSDLESAMIRIAGAVSLVKNSFGFLSDAIETLVIEGQASLKKLFSIIELRIDQLELYFKNFPAAVLQGFSQVAIGISKFFSEVFNDIVSLFENTLSKIGVDVDFSSIRKGIEDLGNFQVDLLTIDDTDTLKQIEDLNNEKLRIEEEYASRRKVIEQQRVADQKKQAEESFKNAQDIARDYQAIIDPLGAALNDDRFKSQIAEPVEKGVEEAKTIATRGFSEVQQEIDAQLAKIDKVKVELEVGTIDKANYDSQIKALTGGLETLYTEQSKLTTSEQQRVEAEKNALAVQKTRTDLLKAQSPLYIKELKAKEEILKAEIELAKLQGDTTTAIEKALELTELQINSNTALTSETKEQQIAIERKLSAQEKINVANKAELENAEKIKKANEKAAVAAEKELKNRKDALKDIRDLQNDLLDLQGKRTDLDKLETLRTDALGAVDADETIAPDLKDQQKGLINQIYDEKAVKAQFQTILDEYLDLLDQFQSATSIQEQNAIEGQINEKQGELEGFAAANDLNPENMRSLTEATNEWNNTLSITDEKLMGLAESLSTTVVDSITEVANGTKTWGEAFQEVGALIIQELIKIGVEMLALKAIEMFTSSAGGGGFGSAIASIFQFHEGGGINDAMVQTRSLDQEVRADEMPAMIKKTETVVSDNKLNQMKASGGGNKTNLYNNIVLDPADVVTQASKTDEWNENLMSFMKSNSNELKQIIS